MNNSLLGLSSKQKKEIVRQQMLEHPTRGYNSLMADLELAICAEKRGYTSPETRKVFIN